jgi:hypothetical protein
MQVRRLSKEGGGMKESPILHAVRIAIASEPDVLLWRCNGGVDTTRGIRYGLGVGAADLIGILKPGRFLALEIKAPKGRPTAEQLLWGGAVQRAGGFYAIVRSVDEAYAALTRARAGAVS